MESSGKNKTGLIIMVIALVLSIGIALVSLASSVYLYFNVASLKSEVSDLQSVKGDVSSLEAKLAAPPSVDITTIQGEIDDLKGKSANPPVFTVASFDLKFEPGSYDDDYAGDGIISCDEKDSYLALLKLTLNSGGTASAQKVQYQFVPVVDGIGKFTTYDWGDTGKLEKPDYSLEVVSYISTAATK